MKKNLPFLIFSSCLFTASGQTNVYHPFPDSNAVWTIQAQGLGYNLTCLSPPELIDYNFSCFIKGDTIINGKTYHKIYRSGYAHDYCWNYQNGGIWWTDSNVLYQGYRNDTTDRKVLMWNGINQECILYDLSLNVGDTLKNGCSNIWGSCSNPVVTAIDSLLIGNKYRKQFHFSNIPYTVIEGIGSTSGLFETVCVFEYSANLICFSQNGQTLYPDSNTFCPLLVTEVQILQQKNLFDLSPNPTTGTFTIESSQKISSVEITDVMGRRIKTRRIEKQEEKIDLSDQPKGIYFIKAQDENENFAVKKIILQ